MEHLVGEKEGVPFQLPSYISLLLKTFLCKANCYCSLLGPCCLELACLVVYWPNTTPGITSYNTFIASYAFEAFAVRGRYEFKEMEYFLARGIGSEERLSICINGSKKAFLTLLYLKTKT